MVVCGRGEDKQGLTAMLSAGGNIASIPKAPNKRGILCEKSRTRGVGWSKGTPKVDLHRMGDAEHA